MKKGTFKKIALVLFLAGIMPGIELSRMYAGGSSDGGSSDNGGGSSGGGSSGTVPGPDGDYYDIDDDGKYSTGDIPVPKDGDGSGGSGTPGGGGGKSQQQTELEAAIQQREEAKAAMNSANGQGHAAQQAAQAQYTAAQANVQSAANSYTNSASGGDPVLLTSGRYVFGETDLELPGSGWTIGRGYVTEEETAGQMGRGWAISLDSRIIRGGTPVDQGQLTEIEGIVAGIRSKAEIQWQYPEARAVGEEIRAIYEDALAQYTDLKTISDRAALLRGLNGLVMYPGTPGFYQDTGNETLTLIDEKGVPFLFEYQGGGVWKPSDPQYRQFMTVTSADGKDAADTSGFVLSGRGGVKKHYDRNGQLAKITELNGDTVTISRNGSGKITAISGPHGNTWTVSYSGNYIGKISGPEGQAVSYGYEGGSLVSVTDTDGDTVKYTYEAGRLKRIVKPDASYIELTYGYDGADGAKLVSATRHEEGDSERFDYNTAQRVTTYTNHSGVVTRYYYDEHHRTTREESGDGTARTFSYNAAGLLSRETVNGDVTTYRYDARGNVSEKQYSDGSRETWAWNGSDLTTRHTDRDGVVTERDYDAKGNCTQIRQGGQVVFTAAYNAQGRITSSREGTRAAYAYAHDSRGYIASRSATDGGRTVTERWKHDALGRVTEYTDGAGRIRTYTYGKRTMTETAPGGLRVTYTYNNRKDLVSITETDTVTGEAREQRAEYDRRHLPLRVTDGAGNVTAYAYREDGELTQTRQGSWTWAYGYDAGGRLSSVTRGMDGSGETSVTRYSYAPGVSGETRSVTTGAGTTSYRFDPWGRVTGVTNALGEASARTLSGAGRVLKEQGASGGNFVYNYDSLGRITGAGKENNTAVHVTYNADGTIAEKTDRNGNRTVYSYDGLGRLVKETSALGETEYRYDGAGRAVYREIRNTNTAGADKYYTAWDYDDSARTVTVTAGGLYTEVWHINAWDEAVRKTDGEGNERSWRYDGAGRLAASADGYGRETRYTWNAIGKVTKITYPDGSEITYEYSHLGLVTKITDGEGVQWEGGYDTDGRLVWEKGRPGIDKAYKYDALGRVTEVRTGGEVTERYSYGSRGRTVTFTDGAGNAFTQEKNAYAEITGETDRLGGRQSYAYDREGRLVEKTAYSGKRTVTERADGAGTTTVTYADGTRSVITRDNGGNVVSATGESGTLLYRYDAGGKLVRQEDEKGGETTEYTYNAAGQRTGMKSGNRNVRYDYGKNGELLRVIDFLQRLEAQYEYDAMGRETARTYRNGVKQETFYDRAGRVILIKETNTHRDILRAEGYLYDALGRRAYSVDEAGNVTVYLYDNQSRLAAVLYPWTDEITAADKKEAAEAGLFFANDKGNPERFSVPLADLAKLRELLDRAQYNRGSLVMFNQILWRQAFTYDANGNRATKTTPWGTIKYEYDAENRLVKKGIITYAYDEDGNLLSETGGYRSAEYRYNGQNRMTYSGVTDHTNGTASISEYAYDAFGRRTISQDAGRTAMRTLYDGFTFEAIRESETFQYGGFTVKHSPGAALPSSTPGIVEEGRFRLVTEGYSTWLGHNPPQTRSNGETVATPEYRYVGINATLYANGEAVAVNRLNTDTYTGGTVYLGKDIMGSVRDISNEYGLLEDRYEYDAFGKPYKGDLNGGINMGYTGKPYNTATGMYNYGYRDYQPEAARFTTVDPIRDGANWFAYVNNDPVNWVDPTGEMPQAVFGGIVGFISSATSEIGGRMASGQSFTEAVSSTIHDPAALTNIAVSTVTGALTAGASSLLTSGATQAGKVAVTNVAVNALGGAVDGAAKSVIGNAVTNQPQNSTQTVTAAVTGFGIAAVSSGVTQGIIARSSTATTTTFSNSYGVTAGTEIKSPAWAGAAGIIGENVLPSALDIIATASKQGGKNH